jgi:diadenosine tetraphosphate (Ap4A) HIT family hydrolase
VLVPRRPGLTELSELHRPDQIVLLDEINALAAALKQLSSAPKTNVAALGNEVRQLHVHVVARSETDLAWPAPVFGRGAPVPYAPGEGEAFAARLCAAVNARPPSAHG